MKRIIIQTIFVLSLMFSMNAVHAETIAITVVHSDNGDKDIPGRGERIPPRPIVCTIDFDSNTIVSTSSLVNNADEYQISTEEGMCFYIIESENEFVETLETLHGTYIITFSGDDYVLSGYFHN